MTQAERIIAIFGGIRPTAAACALPVSTVQGWVTRGWVPAPRQPEVLAAARRLNLPLRPEHFLEGPDAPLSDAPAGGTGAAAE